MENKVKEAFDLLNNVFVDVLEMDIYEIIGFIEVYKVMLLTAQEENFDDDEDLT